MSGRCFLYESLRDNKYTIGRPYGKNGFELRDALRRWLPNGSDIGFELSKEQQDLAYFQQDNFRSRNTIHDNWDQVWKDGGNLYKDRYPVSLI
jgi:hypothetical protein